MAGSAVGDESLSLLGAFHDKKILEVLEDNSVFMQLADKRPIQQRNGNVITFHTVTKFAAGARIVEGIMPAGQFMTGGTKTATIVQFGDKTSISDVMAKGSIADMMTIAVERFGVSAANTIDTYIQDRLFSEQTEDYSGSAAYHTGPTATSQFHRPITTWYDGIHGGLSAYFLSADNSTKVSVTSFSAFYSTGASNADGQAITPAADGLNMSKIRKVVTDLKMANVSPQAGGDYALVVSPKQVNNLMEDPEWREWNRYNNAEKMFKHEVGRVSGCRLIESTNLYASAHSLSQVAGSALTAYLAVFLGNQAFAVTEFAGDTGIKTYRLGFETASHDNLLQQTASVGYKWTGVCKVLDSNQGVGLITFNG